MIGTALLGAVCGMLATNGMLKREKTNLPTIPENNKPNQSKTPRYDFPNIKAMKMSEYEYNKNKANLSVIRELQRKFNLKPGQEIILVEVEVTPPYDWDDY